MRVGPSDAAACASFHSRTIRAENSGSTQDRAPGVLDRAVVVEVGRERFGVEAERDAQGFSGGDVRVGAGDVTAARLGGAARAVDVGGLLERPRPEPSALRAARRDRTPSGITKRVERPPMSVSCRATAQVIISLRAPVTFALIGCVPKLLTSCSKACAIETKILLLVVGVYVGLLSHHMSVLGQSAAILSLRPILNFPFAPPASTVGTLRVLCKAGLPMSLVT